VAEGGRRGRRVPLHRICAQRGLARVQARAAAARGLSARLFLTHRADTPRRLVAACPSLSQPVAACPGLCSLSGAARWAVGCLRPLGLGPRAAPGSVPRAPPNLPLSWPHCLTARDLHAYVHPGSLREQSPEPRTVGWRALCCAGVFSLALLLLAGQSSTPRRPRIVIRISGPRSASSLGALPFVLWINSTPNLPPSTCPSNSPQSMQLPSRLIPKLPSPDLC
jgi:hypothetical protein